jgi:hypothetical protein
MAKLPSQKFKLPSREVSGRRISEALFAVAHRRLTSSEVARFIGSSEPYASACLAILEELKLIDVSPLGFQGIPLVAEDLRKMSLDQRHLVLSRYAMRYKPFVEFLALIHKGYAVIEAATKVNVIYALGVGDRFVEKNLLELAICTHLVRQTNGSYGLNVVIEDLPPDYIDRLREATKGEVQAQLFIRERLATTRINISAENRSRISHMHSSNFGALLEMQLRREVGRWRIFCGQLPRLRGHKNTRRVTVSSNCRVACGVKIRPCCFRAIWRGRSLLE